MPVKVLSSREFNQDTSRAKKATQHGPGFITDLGKPAHVLMTIEDYQRLTRAKGNIVDRLAMPEPDDIKFDPPQAVFNLKPADFS